MMANPFAVRAWFDRSCTLTFAVPAAELAERLPSFLRPDTFDDRWGFVAVAIVQTRGLRPSGFPRFLGRDFILVGFRYFVRYRDQSGRELRGLQIIRSETDRRSMCWLGNFFTAYRYVRTPIQLQVIDGRIEVRAADSGMEIVIEDPSDSQSPLPSGSPFSDWRSARRYCGPLPFTFAHDRHRDRVLIVEGVRSHWQPATVRVVSHHVPYLETLGFSELVLACAFAVRDIPYEWKRGRSEPVRR